MEVGSSLHPTAAVLNAFAQGKIDAAAVEAVRAHLDGCLKCREELAALTNDSQGRHTSPRQHAERSVCQCAAASGSDHPL